MIARCVACNRRLSAQGTCSCGVRGGSAPPDPRPFLTLEEHSGYGPEDRIQPDASLTKMFGGTLPGGGGNPRVELLGTKLVRNFRGVVELEWHSETIAEDLRWTSARIVHYRGPLSEPPPGPIPRMRDTRELRDCSVKLFEALLLGEPPHELRTIEVHASVAQAEQVVARAREFPALEFLVVHFLERDAGQVLTDQLLEQHPWLDCRSLESGTSVFGIRRS